VARQCAAERWLTASFFFTRGKSGNLTSARKLTTTVTVQLMAMQSVLRPRICRAAAGVAQRS
jgi:hypothetical protein